MVHAFDKTTPRQQKREVTFDRIIETAMAALAKGGLGSLTMQNLAGELGFAVGALYRYFPGKDGIIVAVQRRIIESVREELIAALAKADQHAAGLDPRKAALLRLWVTVQVYEAMSRTRPTEFGLLSMTLGDPRQLVQDEDAGHLVPAMASLLQTVGALFSAASEAGALTPGDQTRRTMVLWTSAQGALQLRKLERFGVGIEASAVLDEAVSTLLAGWGADVHELEAMRRRAQQLPGTSP
jgi:AcrR family transcriptional regulator